jgi:hypothetical protein
MSLDDRVDICGDSGLGECLANASTLAFELGILDDNPIPALKWSPPKSAGTVDRRRVASPDADANPAQRGPHSTPDRAAARGLLWLPVLRRDATRRGRGAPQIPEKGWGEILLEGAEPHAGSEWTDSGEKRDDRGLKHRARDETRPVPCPPELTALLHAHLAAYGTAPDGRLFEENATRVSYPRSPSGVPGNRQDGRWSRRRYWRRRSRARRTTFDTPCCRHG